ncbi:hypothetical protein FRC01_006980, partial [Tulasnella sp. 417]
MAESGTSTTSSASSLNYDALRRVFDQSAHFYITKDRLVIGNECLGQGGFGAVFPGKLKPVVKGSTPGPESEWKDVAVKKLRPNAIDLEPERQAFRLAREMLVWSSCKHENILEFVGYHLSDDFEIAYLISPYMKNGSAEAYLAKVNATTEERFKL